jgi:hypothetical protein
MTEGYAPGAYQTCRFSNETGPFREGSFFTDPREFEVFKRGPCGSPKAVTLEVVRQTTHVRHNRRRFSYQDLLGDATPRRDSKFLERGTGIGPVPPAWKARKSIPVWQFPAIGPLIFESRSGVTHRMSEDEHGGAGRIATSRRCSSTASIPYPTGPSSGSYGSIKPILFQLFTGIWLDRFHTGAYTCIIHERSKQQGTPSSSPYPKLDCASRTNAIGS